MHTALVRCTSEATHTQTKKCNFLALSRHDAAARGWKTHKTANPVALIHFSKSELSEWFPELCVRPLQNPALVLECRLTEERAHPRGALLLIVEGQLKPQPKPGFAWNWGLMRSMGRNRSEGQRGEIRAEGRRRLSLFRCCLAARARYVVALCCRRQNAARSEWRSEKHLWQE